MTSHSVLDSSGYVTTLPELSTRIKSASISVIKEMMYLGAEETAKGRDIVSLGVGTPYYRAPEHIHDHVIKQLKEKPDIDKYTLFTGIPRLRQLFADHATKTLGFEALASEIVVTPGSMSALFYTMLTLVDRGDEVIIPCPYFPSYAEQIHMAEGSVVPVPMIEDEKEGFRLDVNAIKNAVTKRTKAIVLNSPHNPTGTVFTKRDLTAVAEILKKHKIYVITDEVYDYLTFDALGYYNIASIRELWPRVVRCFSLSKKYGMMGWRLGYLHTNHALLMHILKIHDSAAVCAPHVAQEAAIAALTGPQDVVIHHAKLLFDNRDIICARLDIVPDLFSYVRPHGAYYIFPRFKIPMTSIDLAKRLLYEAGVITVPGIGFGPAGEHHLRLSFGAPPADIHKAFDRIETWWKKEKK